MIYLKSINELFGINNAIRMVRNEDEIEARDIQILLSKGKYTDLNFSEKKVQGQLIKAYTFNIDSHRSYVDNEKVRVEFSNWLPIYTPGMTDFRIYLNDKQLNCSRKISKDIFKYLSRLA